MEIKSEYHIPGRSPKMLRLRTSPPYGPQPYEGGGSLVSAQAMPVWMPGLTGVQLDLTTRNKTRGSTRHTTVYLERSAALDLAQAILLAVPRAGIDEA